jgi:hypothetical protein
METVFFFLFFFVFCWLLGGNGISDDTELQVRLIFYVGKLFEARVCMRLLDMILILIPIVILGQEKWILDGETSFLKPNFTVLNRR